MEKAALTHADQSNQFPAWAIFPALRLVYRAEPIPQHAIYIILKLLMQNGKKLYFKIDITIFFSVRFRVYASNCAMCTWQQ